MYDKSTREYNRQNCKRRQRASEIGFEIFRSVHTNLLTGANYQRRKYMITTVVVMHTEDAYSLIIKFPLRSEIKEIVECEKFNLKYHTTASDKKI